METQNANVASGITSFTSGTRTLRQINFIQFNTLSVTISSTAPSWTIFIPTAGTYIFRSRACINFFRTTTGNSPIVQSKLFIRNDTLNLDDWLIGESSKSFLLDSASTSANALNFYNECNGIKTISGPNTILLQQVCVPNAAFTVNGG